ncbi:FdhF/YdeP family oxidoreductase [Rhizobium sp. NTR19]|uniref:FdhF/YdeP family oxidoreductase n=1 Tax=Neorhizobium turbinariae TaxID=2937795 RepID=A0ABT0IP90_9HYPH|nr:FdhF/YdeP family oxidoreductase [Neorhizobium turbinariae]MCK8779686.1 FdhF/YdeP family oxidoreductase [Neorhizobium turbinariae]
MTTNIRIKRYEGPAGGWGSVQSLFRNALKNKVRLSTADALLRQNKKKGFACVSCAWAKPAKPHAAEFCENGAKATFWELTKKTATPEFFASHTVSELRTWDDYHLEAVGRLTHPMRYDHLLDVYEPVSWEIAFEEIGRELKAIRADDPKKAVFYASGRASLETSYMYQLFARLYGNNNLPDSSNMCHETTSVALPEVIGQPVGSVRLEDFEHADAIFFFGQNTGSNSPRMLHQLQEAVKRGCTIVTFNPLKERGLERFTNPQSPTEMLTGGETQISHRYYQLKAGGDIAAIIGMCKSLFEREAASGGVLDHKFIQEHCHGFSEFHTFCEEQAWGVLEAESGLQRSDMEEAAEIYARANSVMGVYGMGLTQHKHGVSSVQSLVNLLLLRGNIGKPGAGICPVRGHSNVQGQRTVGISEKPELVPLDKLAELYHFDPPREEGLTTVDACQAILNGEIKAFIGLGGNFLRAIPETGPMEDAWPRMRLTVQVATKLNRNHLFNGDVAYLLPCLGRLELDEQKTGPQVVTIEDSTSCFHASKGRYKPISEHLLSEPRIVAEIAKASLPPNPNVPWDEWVADYGKVREAIERTYPAIFKDFNRRMWTPGGFEKPLSANKREWKTETGKANFRLPKALSASFDAGTSKDVLRLITLRSNDQFNTTVYGYHDRFRGVEGTRMVIFVNPKDMQRFGITEGQDVRLETVASDNIPRSLGGLRAVPYDIPEGCCGAYYPECNILLPLYQHAEGSKVPAAKSVPVRVSADEGGLALQAAE